MRLFVSFLLAGLLALAALILPGGAAYAVQTAWQSFGLSDRLDVVSARLIGGVVAEEGAVLAVELVLAPDWHTYSKEPGASGIAPHFDWTGSLDFTPDAPQFLPPSKFREAAGDVFGYDTATVFFIPVKNISDPATIRLGLDIGVCREICLPVHFDFALTATLADFTASPLSGVIDGLWPMRAVLVEKKPPE